MVILGSLFRHSSMFTMIIYSITADITSDRHLSSRFAALTAARYIGQSVGALLAGALDDAGGAQYSMLASSALQSLNFLLIVVAVKETVPQSQPKNQSTLRGSNCDLLKTVMCCHRGRRSGRN
ncbi:hypothetical protein BaRGS_00029469 [Batillaria attramentaria]|uniref:Major facilitator superfamily (MFS) profile domain-containing protein n=1 Tax=Batillaria attramentaria TaxID=370345 RepID=A0ABD0JW37_9CAEN